MTATGWDLDEGAQRGRDMMALARALFPVHRTLVNRGYDESLELIGRVLPLDVLAYPSGTPVWDWVVPDAWDVNEAWIEDSRGTRLVDFAANSLHLSAYSEPFDGTVSREELLAHVRTLPDQPDAIPYNVLYYRGGWEFNVAHRHLARFTDDRYRVRIDVSTGPGALKVACCHLPGRSRREVLFSTYLCHPSLANDNISGVVTAVELFKALSALSRRRYSYRLLIGPETIGAITWLAHHEAHLADVSGVYTVYDCGDRGPIHYKRSFLGDAYVDRVAEHVLEHHVPGAVIRDWVPYGSDERQYAAPGVRLPAGAFTRTPAGEFPEYHTSLDTLALLSADALLESVRTLYRFVGVWERDLTWVNTYKGEPCLARHRIRYPSHFGDRGDESKFLVKKVMHELDGEHSVLDIARKWGAPFDQVDALVRQFEAAGLVRLLASSAPVPAVEVIAR
jgi:aminopeptidase-like protein